MKQDQTDAATKAMAARIRKIAEIQGISVDQSKTLIALQEGRHDLVKLTDLLELASLLNVSLSRFSF